MRDPTSRFTATSASSGPSVACVLAGPPEVTAADMLKAMIRRRRWRAAGVGPHDVSWDASLCGRRPERRIPTSFA